VGKIKLALALVVFFMLLHPVGARDGEGMRVVPAQEILDKIERGEPVEYDHVIVEGDLDLGRLELPKRHVNRTANEKYSGLSENATLVSSIVRINASIINGNISLANAIISNSFNFRDSHFNGSVEFMGSIFIDNAEFDNAFFSKNIEFWFSIFNCNAGFKGSDFNGGANFIYSVFDSSADFYGSTFNDSASFYGSVFNGHAQFAESFFNNYATFCESVFVGHADFWNSNFKEFADFSLSVFKKDAVFDGARFDCHLDLTRTKYERLYIRWNSIKDIKYDDAAYLSLLENFKKLGYLEDYDACYYEYRQLHRDHDWSGGYHAMHPWEKWARKKIDLGLQAFYGYGKKPLWPLLWSAGTIMLFGLIWRRAGVDGGRSRGGILERFSPSGKKKRKTSLDEQLRALGGAMLFSATLFLSGTRLFVDPPAMPKLEGWLAAHARSFFIAERVLGAFFSILFFLAVSGTVVR